MKTMKWNGENWYCDADSLFKRARRWVIWIGGWERTKRSSDGEYNLIASHEWAPRVHRVHGREWWKFPQNVADSLTPISLFGHRVTYFGWGIQVKPKRYGARIFVVSRSGLRKGEPTKVYLSPDGTPSSATTWFRGWKSEAWRFKRLEF